MACDRIVRFSAYPKPSREDIANLLQDYFGLGGATSIKWNTDRFDVLMVGNCSSPRARYRARLGLPGSDLKIIARLSSYRANGGVTGVCRTCSRTRAKELYPLPGKEPVTTRTKRARSADGFVRGLHKKAVLLRMQGREREGLLRDALERLRHNRGPWTERYDIASRALAETAPKASNPEPTTGATVKQYTIVVCAPRVVTTYARTWDGYVALQLWWTT